MGGLGSSTFRRVVRSKLARLRGGAQPRLVDLFAGCGGMSLGAQLAGCEITAAVELDPAAARSHALNFHEGNEAHGVARDISKTDPHQLMADLGVAGRNPMRMIDVLVGGPPCQAFARVGRAKLREVMDHPDAFLHDARSGLYRDYLRFVEALAPAVIIIENVPDVLNYGGLNIFETIAAALDKAGYECSYGLMNAVHLGVPQMRTRCFLVGVARVADTASVLPDLTHYHELPVGYRGTRQVALRHLHPQFEGSHYFDVPEPASDLPSAICARDAIGDLPPITAHIRGLMKKAHQKLDKPIATPAPHEATGFATMMREWSGFESEGFVRDHVTRYQPRDFKIFKRMRPGDQYPEAHALSERMFQEALSMEVSAPRPSSARYKELKAQYVPPYDPTKFPNKWRKMEADQPTRTLLAHLGKDSYSHIHYESKQCRTISIREAARLQSFPDGFRFCGTMNPAFRQIGNAVPPLMAYAVLSRQLAELGICKSALVANS